MENACNPPEDNSSKHPSQKREGGHLAADPDTANRGEIKCGAAVNLTRGLVGSGARNWYAALIRLWGVTAGLIVRSSARRSAKYQTTSHENTNAVTRLVHYHTHDIHQSRH